MIVLKHHDDGKEKWNSHLITCDEVDPVKITLNVTNIYGCGETKEEAMAEFRKNMEMAFKELEAFTKLLLETDSLVPIEVDCLGKPI